MQELGGSYLTAFLWREEPMLLYFMRVPWVLLLRLGESWSLMGRPAEVELLSLAVD